MVVLGFVDTARFGVNDNEAEVCGQINQIIVKAERYVVYGL